MSNKISRRLAIASVAGATAALAAAPRGARAEDDAPAKLKGRIHHSVCRWCYGGIPLDEFCQKAKAIGITSIDLCGPGEWPTLKKHGLTCAMCSGGNSLSDGFNNPDNHDKLVAAYEPMIDKVAEAGYENLICFSGNRGKLDDQQGLKNCVTGLKRLIKQAEDKKVNLVMELLNSKVDHHGYQCDHTAWGVELCKQLGSDRMKLLYDIYHMQIMEGDVIATIRKSIKHIAHFHTGGVPGRNEIDESQELFYPAIMRAIVATGYQGFVAQEFIPKQGNPLKSLAKCVQICDV